MANESELLAQLQDLQAQLAATQAQQWKLIRLVCHELNQPLSSIKGYNDLLPLTGTMTDQQKDFIARIKKNVVRMSGMIANLHDLAYMGENSFKLKLTAQSPREVIEKICDKMQAVAAEYGNTLTCALPDTLDAVLADRERLEQILRILIENACWYTPSGGRVTVTAAQADGNLVEISVTDTGIGVPEAERKLLFTLFRRGEAQIVRERVGAGMNLHMLSRLVEMMGGAYGADFPPEGGSRFWVRLPIAH
jgi:signal transduction histidine kinase